MDMERSQGLLEREAAAQSELDAARRGLALADLGNTQQNVVTVRAPSGGRVLRVYEPSERVIPPGTALVDIAEAGRLEIAVDVLSTDAVRIRAGATMHVVNWGGATR